MQHVDSRVRFEAEAAPQALQVLEGLQGVVATRTRLSRVEGAAGRLTIAGYDVAELAPRVCFEAMAFLLLHDRLPSADELALFQSGIARHRKLDASTLELLRSAAQAQATPMATLRLGVASLVGETPTPERLLSVLPLLAATYA